MLNKIQHGLASGAAAVGASAALPLVFGKAVLDAKWRTGLEERRLKGGWEGLSGSVSARNIWFHAASVGELQGLLPVLMRVSEQFSEFEKVITTTSLTGQNAVREKELARHSFLFPLDHPCYVGKALSKVSPSLVVVAETELWPNFLFALQRRQVPAVLINARISDYTFSRYQKFRAVFAPALRAFQAILCQSQLDAERFVALGAAESLVRVTGCTKFDTSPVMTEPAQREAFLNSLGFDSDRPTFVAGSIRPVEDEQVIDAFLKARQQVPGMQAVLAPRHPERFDAVANLLNARGHSFWRRSQGQPKSTVDTVLLDTLGELSSAYAVSDLSFVGGTLVDVGGHNPMEPASCGVPVMMGPNVGNVRDAVASLETEGGVQFVSNSNELSVSLVEFLQNADKRQSFGLGAKRAWEQHRGASDRVVDEIALALNAEKDGEVRFEYRSLLAPLSSLYGVGTRVRNLAYDSAVFKTTAVSLPVFCVGNIAIGGSGKTPFVDFLVSLLRKKGKQPAILMRGYGGSIAGPHPVRDSDKVADVGDEALLHVENLSDVPVVISRDRVKGAEFIAEQNLGDVIVLDDGFQHRRLHRNLDLILVDISSANACRDWLEGKVLPGGNWRESRDKALERADAVVFVERTASPAKSQLQESLLAPLPKELPWLHFQLCPRHFVDVFSGEKHSLEQSKGLSTRALTAIAKPESFFSMLSELGIPLLSQRALRDHHQYDAEEVRGYLGELADGQVLVTTSKDAVKLRPHLKGPGKVFALALDGDLSDTQQRESFSQLLESKF